MTKHRWLMLLALVITAFALVTAAATTTTTTAAARPRREQRQRRQAIVKNDGERREPSHDRLEELHRAEGPRRDLRPGARGRRLQVKTQLNLGDEKTALKALKDGEIRRLPRVHRHGADCRSSA